MEESGSVLFQPDELGRFLKTTRNAAASHLYLVQSVLMEMYSTAASVFDGDVFADTKRTHKIVEPHLVLYATTVPRSLFEALTVESLTDGFLSRFLVFETDEHDPSPQEFEKGSIPPQIIDAAVTWRDLRSCEIGRAKPKMLSWTEGATQILRDFGQEASLATKDSDAPVARIWTRAREKAHKLSLLHACSEHGTEVMSIDERAATWAVELVRHLTRRILFVAEQRVGENKQERNLKKVLLVISEAGLEGITRNDLTRRFQWLLDRDRKEIIATLETTGQVIERVEKTGGRDRTKLVRSS